MKYPDDLRDSQKSNFSSLKWQKIVKPHIFGQMNSSVRLLINTQLVLKNNSR